MSGRGRSSNPAGHRSSRADAGVRDTRDRTPVLFWSAREASILGVGSGGDEGERGMSDQPNGNPVVMC